MLVSIKDTEKLESNITCNSIKLNVTLKLKRKSLLQY